MSQVHIVFHNILSVLQKNISALYDVHTSVSGPVQRKNMIVSRTGIAIAQLALIGAILSACSVRIQEDNLLRPMAGGTLSQEVLTIGNSPYSVARQEIRAADGTRLHAVHLTRPGANVTVLYFGGNGYTVGAFGTKTAEVFAPLGVNLMIVDHRGYGQSEGQPSVAALMSDGIAAFDHLAALPGAGKILVHGQSLGSFIAGHVAAHRPTAGVVLESSVTTAEAWVKARAKNMPVKIRLADTLKGQGNLRNMALIDEPMLILAGSEDKATPPQLSRDLYNASHLPEGRKLLAIVEGASHNDVLLKPEAIEAYRVLIDRINGN
ncbi:alpha/beta hydrolase [Allosphingosinicella flava]|uniref:Alpha/beta hydrolase n=1 Tax=Allosphingosinicella flava TaxID=2771430 RepID=A0A7T2LN12_9SPHN|nr:alpha/beta hydrolase [Sphingosinicella flava]QPQ55868.1 alpha/beta hydrolase [Sphingosinicella flava]